jgi:hypothetical protein
MHMHMHMQMQYVVVAFAALCGGFGGQLGR